MEGPSIDSFIYKRDVVDQIDEAVVRHLIVSTEEFMRNQNVEGVIGLLSPNFEIITPMMSNGRLEKTSLDKTRFLETLYATFATSNTDKYTMKILSIELNQFDNALAEVEVSNPKDRNFSNVWGGPINEFISVSLHEGRPVVEKVEVQNDI